jgi:hypothetical protein
MILDDLPTHFIAFMMGAVIGAAGKYLADTLTDRCHRQEARAQAVKRFEMVQLTMPLSSRK